MIDATTLLADTRRTVNDLVDDLRQVAAKDPAARAHVADEYQRAHTAGRTALGQAEWAEGLYAQVAVAWTLGCVFVRFCEDNGLISEPLLGGPGLRAQLALDQRAAHLHANPAHDDRHWLREVFSRLRALPATGEVFGAHNPIWIEGLLPSADGARRLREELTRIDPDAGQLRHDFTDPEWDTRFLGNLYQDLSDHAKKTYALLQTPVFVEEFILDRTLDPAIATFGLADTTIIDPTCGSGHFLLGAFARLFERWVDTQPGTSRRVLAQRSLDAIGGIDLNPFAASIARFRLMLAAMRAGGDDRLSDAPAYDLNVAVGDSLLHGDPPGALPGMHVPGEEEALLISHGYAVEDHTATRALLSRTWAAVVGNPPYIAVADAGLRAAYKRRFTVSCRGKWTLGMPFIERFWQLADDSRSRSGYVGMIVDNSFMKREKGKQLVEQWFPRHDLTHVIDVSGAYIPGHGTPTVILCGRNRPPVSRSVRTVMGIRGEPSTPADPEKGLVWSSVVQLVDDPGSQSEYVSVVDLDRDRLGSHPWSIGGGGAAELKELLDSQRSQTLGALVDAIGPTAVPGTDDVYVLGDANLARARIELRRPYVTGDLVRDYATDPSAAAFPYDDLLNVVPDVDLPASDFRWYWTYRSLLASYLMFGKLKSERGLQPHEWGYLLAERLRSPLSIPFAFVATHNHFALDRGGAVFNRHAPVVKLPKSSGEQDYLELLGLLNSSTACFWMKQVFHNKGASVDAKGARQTTVVFENFYEFDGTKLKLFPLPSGRPLDTATLLDRLANDMVSAAPAAVARRAVPTATDLMTSHGTSLLLRAQLIAAQERLDWECYKLYGLTDENLISEAEPEPPLVLGERAFEIGLARRIAAGEEESTTWFARHGSTPITELPQHWSPGYRALVERRIELIEMNLSVGLIERPEHKRRWSSRPWGERVLDALRAWLADRLENARYWPNAPTLTTVARLAADVRTDSDFVQVARLYLGRDDVDFARLIAELVHGDSVAYLAAHREAAWDPRGSIAWK